MLNASRPRRRNRTGRALRAGAAPALVLALTALTGCGSDYPLGEEQRRAAEEGGSDAAAVEAVLRSRDAIDSGRAASPLTQVDGAAHLDTTHLTLDEVIEEVVALVRAVEVDA